MPSKISVSTLADAVQKELAVWKDDVDEAVVAAVNSTTKHAVRQLRQKSPVLTGDYRRGWTSVKTTDQKGRYVKTVCNRPSEYRLTHLLEKGHKKTGGGTVPAVVHIQPVREDAADELRTLIKEALE